MACLVVHLLSHCQTLCDLWTAARQASLSITVSQSLLKLMSNESVMPSTILSSVVLFSSCLQSFSASRSFPMSRLFASGGQSIGASVIMLLKPNFITFQEPPSPNTITWGAAPSTYGFVGRSKDSIHNSYV